MLTGTLATQSLNLAANTAGVDTRRAHDKPSLKVLGCSLSGAGDDLRKSAGINEFIGQRARVVLHLELRFGTKPCTGGYAVATQPQKKKGLLSLS
jgi:hypothetical protein